MILKECPICGRVFTASRRDAVYCSHTCRQRKYDRRAQIDEETAKWATSDNVAMVIDKAHAAAVDMSRVAMVAPMPLAESLGRVAGKIEGALRDEGL